MEKTFMRALVSFGFPGIALGMFYLVLETFDFRFSEIDPTMSGLIVLFMLGIFSYILIKGLKTFSGNKHNVCNIFYAGSDSMKLIKALESGAELKEIINSAYQMIHQMKSSGYSKNISYIPMLENKIQAFESRNEQQPLTPEENEKLKNLVLNIKSAYAQNMVNIQPDYVPYPPGREKEWQESRSQNLKPSTPGNRTQSDV